MRTVGDFVRDMREKGRNDSQILSVAQVTNWLSRLSDVKQYLKEHKPEKKKKSK